MSESQTSRLTVDEERAIVRYCHNRDLMKLPLPLYEVKSYADYLLEQKVQSLEEFKPVRSRQTRRFMDRYGIKKVKHKPI